MQGIAMLIKTKTCPNILTRLHYQMESRAKGRSPLSKLSKR